MPWYPNGGPKGLEWWNGSLDIPTMSKDTRRIYPRLAKNWRNDSSYWYSQNPTSYTPEYTDKTVGDMRNINEVQTQNVQDVVDRSTGGIGSHNAPAAQALDTKLANNQGADMAQSESDMRNMQERERYNDWLKWAGTAAERKDSLDDLNMARSNLLMQNEMMNSQPSQGGTDWMSLLSSGAGMLGQMTQPYLTPALGQLGSAAGSGLGWLGSLGSAAGAGLGSLGSAAGAGLGSLGSAAGAGIMSSLGWLAGLL